MSILGTVLGEGIAKPIAAIGNVIDKLFTSDDEKLSKQILLERLTQEPQMAQIEINKLMAQHYSVFVSGGRPFIIWICGIGLGLYFIPQYVLGAIFWSKECWASGHLIAYPISAKGLMDLVWPLLGFGAYRTIEKIKGVARK